MPTTAIVSLSGLRAMALDLPCASWLESRNAASFTHPRESDRHIEKELAAWTIHEAREITQAALLRQFDRGSDDRLPQAVVWIALLVDQGEHEELAVAAHLRGLQLPGKALRTKRSVGVDPIPTSNALVDQQLAAQQAAIVRDVIPVNENAAKRREDLVVIDLFSRHDVTSCAAHWFSVTRSSFPLARRGRLSTKTISRGTLKRANRNSSHACSSCRSSG